MQLSSFMFIVALILYGGFFYLLFLIILALRKYIREAPAQKAEKQAIRMSLSESLKKHRQERGFTQEYVAEALSVSRQAVSKWETGTSDPSTSNLIALGRLYGIEPAELLRGLGTDEPRSDFPGKSG